MSAEKPSWSSKERETYCMTGFFRPEKLSLLRKEPWAQGPEAAADMKQLDAKIAAGKAMQQKAAVLARQGRERDSLELNDLKEAIKALLGPAFIGAIYQAFDQAKQDSQAAIESGPPSTAEKKGLLRQDQAIGNRNNATESQSRPAGSPKTSVCSFPDIPDQLLSVKSLITDYAIKGLWTGPSSVDAMSQARQLLLSKAGDRAAAAEELLTQIDAWLVPARAILTSAEQTAKQQPAANQQALQSIRADAEAAGGQLLVQLVNKAVAGVENMRKKYLAAKRHGEPRIENHGPRQLPRQNVALPMTRPEDNARSLEYPSHQNDIVHLQPSPKWTLLIDESGNDFEKNGNGLIAGVLMPADRPLPPISPSLHATTDREPKLLQRADQALQDLLDGPYGVLALPVRALRSPGDWIGAVGSFIDLVLRMLPLDFTPKAQTQVDILIENRGVYHSPANLIYLRDACRFKLMHMYPERAERLKFELDIMSKKESFFDSYPDVVAHSCMAKSDLPKKRLKKTGWNGTCYLNYSAEQIANALDYFYTWRLLPAEDWAQLLNSYDSHGSTSLIDGLLSAFGAEAMGNCAEWTRYLDYTIGHLNSKAISIRELGKQVTWLARYQPVEAELPPRLKLTWLTVKLAEANHRGEVNALSLAEYRALADSLYEEDAPLVCWADLHLAVQYTNAFQFTEATAAIARWRDVPPAVPGLKYHGQLQSTFGQHLAFTGELVPAAVHFQQAITEFARLSDPKEAEKNIDQTRAYNLTVLMDMPDRSLDEIEEEMFRYFHMSAVDAAGKLAIDAADKTKYQHHLLLRFLAAHPEHPATAAYLAKKSQWASGSGHPWPLVYFYRAMLVADPSERLALLRQALQTVDADRPGLTLQYMATVLAGALYSCEPSCRDDFAARLEAIRTKLPMIADRLALLDAHLLNPLAPLALVMAALPFNFR